MALRGHSWRTKVTGISVAPSQLKVFGSQQQGGKALSILQAFFFDSASDANPQSFELVLSPK